MRQRHPAGERLFVDYAGQTVDVICPKTGEVRTAQIFVAALGPSTPTATATVGFVNFTPVGRAVCRRSCASATLPGSGYSWIMPG